MADSFIDALVENGFAKTSAENLALTCVTNGQYRNMITILDTKPIVGVIFPNPIDKLAFLNHANITNSNAGAAFWERPANIGGKHYTWGQMYNEVIQPDDQPSLNMSDAIHALIKKDPLNNINSMLKRADNGELPICPELLSSLDKLNSNITVPPITIDDELPPPDGTNITTEAKTRT